MRRTKCLPNESQVMFLSYKIFHCYQPLGWICFSSGILQVSVHTV